MSRRKAREMALQALFQLDFNSISAEEALHSVFVERDDISNKAKSYAETLVQGTTAHMAEIDGIITGISNEWKIERMAGVERNIARIAIYEMKFGADDLPPKVAVNEAVELAKHFGTEESGRFVNGILDSLVKVKANARQD